MHQQDKVKNDICNKRNTYINIVKFTLHITEANTKAWWQHVLGSEIRVGKLSCIEQNKVATHIASLVEAASSSRSRPCSSLYIRSASSSTLCKDLSTLKLYRVTRSILDEVDHLQGYIINASITQSKNLKITSWREHLITTFVTSLLIEVISKTTM